MKKNPSSQSGLFNPRAFVAFTLCSVGALLAMVSFAAPRPRPAPPTFGHPIISGIGGGGFWQGLRGGPPHSNPPSTPAPRPLFSFPRWVLGSPPGGKKFKIGVGASALV